jgi:hypothetical protein
VVAASPDVGRPQAVVMDVVNGRRGRPSRTAARCPNPNCTGVNPQLTVTDITENISQVGVLLFTCTASNPAGLSYPVALSCLPA